MAGTCPLGRRKGCLVLLWAGPGGRGARCPPLPLAGGGGTPQGPSGRPLLHSWSRRAAAPWEAAPWLHRSAPCPWRGGDQYQPGQRRGNV